VRKGVDGAVTVDITSLQIGAPRKWILHGDIGTEGSLGTIVYPIKTTYTQKTLP